MRLIVLLNSAEWINAVSSVFGRPARVRVRVGGVVLLDSKTLTQATP